MLGTWAFSPINDSFDGCIAKFYVNWLPGAFCYLFYLLRNAYPFMIFLHKHARDIDEIMT